MIYFIQFIKEPRKSLFTFTHPVTPHEILEKVSSKFSQTQLSYLKNEEQIISSRKIDFKNYTFQVWELSLNNSNQINVIALYDKQDSSQLVLNIINDSLTPHIRARIIKGIKRGAISEKTKNLLRDRFLNKINGKIDPLSRRWQREKWKKVTTLIGGLSLSSLFFTIKLLTPTLHNFFNTFHFFACFCLISGLIGYLSHKNMEVLKSSLLLIISTLGSYMAIISVTNRFSLFSLQILPLLIYGCLLFLVSNFILVLVNSHYISPPP